MTLRAVDQVEMCCATCTTRARYVRTLANMMGLRDWTIEVVHSPPSDASMVATVELARERKVMRASFAEEFEELSAADRRHATVHELIHPILRDLYETVREAAAEEIGGAAGRVFMSAVRRDIERATDVLASVLAPHLPEPD